MICSKIKSQYISILILLLLSLLFTNLIYAEQNNMTYNPYVKTNIPDVTTDMLFPSFWINLIKDPDKLIGDENDIKAYNNKNIKNCPPIVNLENYPETFTKEQLIKLITNISRPSQNNRYDSYGQLVGISYYKELEKNLNLESLNDINSVSYGIVVRRSELRTYPIYDKLYSSPDSEFDRFMETAVYIAEPIIILSESRDKKWFFAQMYNYLAWIPASDTAITSKTNWNNYVKISDFLVITGNDVYTNYNPINKKVSNIKLDMGVKIPLASGDEIPDDINGQSTSGNYAVKLPTRDDSGNLEIQLALIPIICDVHIGYLPYTQRNIINQAFKLLGERYSWGGSFYGRDCTAFTMDIFRTMGIKLPRNSSEQGKLAAGIYYDMTVAITYEERAKLIDNISPGTALYMNGHALLYIGRYDKNYYAIHDFAGFILKENNTAKYYSVLEVAVTPLNILTSSGKTFLEALYGARFFSLK